MGQRSTDPRLKKLRDDGNTVWSYSRINTFNQCSLGYWLNYIKKNNNLQNIYSYMGGVIHDAIEAYQNKGLEGHGVWKMDGITDDEFEQLQNDDMGYIRKKYYEGLVESEMLGMKFPNESIGESWRKCMEDWLDKFEKIDRKMATEKLFILEIVDGLWIHGYIDVIMPNEDNESLDIMDWKTSSKFTGKDLIKSGRQLLLYKLGVENNFGRDVKELSWYMFKLINLCSTMKNGKTKKVLLPRHKWVKDNRKPFENALKKANVDEFEIGIYITEAIKNNNIDGFPSEVKDQYWIEDGYVYYDSNEENISELKEYISSSVEKINSLDKEDMAQWDVKPITPKESFFCSNLCGVRESCHRYKDYIDKLKESGKI